MQTSDERLVPYLEGLRKIGVRSHNTGAKLVERGDLPEPIKRGRFKFFLASDLERYISTLASTSREVAR